MASMQYFTIKINDLLPVLTGTLVDDDARTAQDLTGATVTLQLKYQSGEIKLVASMTVLDPPTAGRIQYDWQAGDTSETGVFMAEVLVVFPGNVQRTYPTVGYKRVRVIDTLTVLE